MGKLKCWFGNHIWSEWQFITKSKPPHYQRYCENCGKTERLERQEYLDKREEDFKEILSCYEVLFRLIDVKLGAGSFSDCYELVNNMYNDKLKFIDQSHKTRFYETIVSGIKYLHRPSPDNPNEYSTQFWGGACYSSVKTGPSHLPSHHIPDRLEQELEKLKNFYK